MKKSDIHPMPEYLDRYINLVPDVPLQDAFRGSLLQIDACNISLLEERGLYSYETGKWTVKEVLQHITDCERIMCYRGLLIARGDLTVAAGFEPDLLAENSNANNRHVSEILDELKKVRLATIALFDSFSSEVLQRRGINWKYEINVLALGFTIPGHQSWHFKILRDVYKQAI